MRPTAWASTSRWTAATARAAPARRFVEERHVRGRRLHRGRADRRGGGGGLRPGLPDEAPVSDMVLRVAAASDACKTQARSLCRDHRWRDERLSDTTTGVHHPDVEGKPPRVPAGPVCERRGAGQRAAAVVLVQLAARGGGGRCSWCATYPGGLMTTFLDGAQPGIARDVHGAGRRSFYLRDVKRPVLMLAGAPGWRRSCPCWTGWRRPAARIRSTWCMA